MDNYRFEELQIYGDAHFAILTEPHNKDSELFFLYMIGDRTGTVHLGENQVRHTGYNRDSDLSESGL